MKKDKSLIFVVGFLFLFIFMIIFSVLKSNSVILDKKNIDNKFALFKSNEIELSFSDILRKKNDIQSITINGNNASGILKDGKKFKTNIIYDTNLLADLSKHGTIVKISNNKSFIEIFSSYIFLFIGIFFLFFIIKGLRGIKGGIGGSIGKSLVSQNPTKIITGKSKTTFKDVAGVDAARDELFEMVKFLKDGKLYKKLGAVLPRGILLSGEPGTGKTLLARAVAGEIDIPFFAVSGSDFSGIIVGLGVAKIKEIFEMARKNAPCILFIDEIDAIGQKRSQHSFNDHDREQTLNQLLIEMDGFSNDTGVIVIGATNRPDTLDLALIRPGRLDKQIFVDLPDYDGRVDILNLYSSKIKLSKNVNIEDIARGTTGFSGADLKNLLNEAALIAVSLEHNEVMLTDIDEAIDKILMGHKKSKKMLDKEKKLTAYHEAGHAYIGALYKDIIEPIHKATIVPRGRSLGMVQFLPESYKVSVTKEEIKAKINLAFAGRASEEVFFGKDKITTGASSDIKHATTLAVNSITKWGFSEKVGLVETKDLKNLANISDKEVKLWLDNAYKDTINLIKKGKNIIKNIAEELLKKETLTGEEVLKIVFKTKKKNVKK